jgi:hypothetical protein
MYKCELVNEGVVVERFFRDGESIDDVQAGLEMFRWPRGKWTISEAGEEREVKND